MIRRSTCSVAFSPTVSCWPPFSEVPEMICNSPSATVVPSLTSPELVPVQFASGRSCCLAILTISSSLGSAEVPKLVISIGLPPPALTIIVVLLPLSNTVVCTAERSIILLTAASPVLSATATSPTKDTPSMTTSASALAAVCSEITIA